MRIAIVHDVFIESGGAERVLFTLVKMFPSADIFIPLLSKENNSHLSKFTKGRIYSSLFNKIPFIHSASIILKPFLYLYWELLDLKQYELVISSSHSFSSKSILTGPDTLHLSYIHTPPRYLYTEFNETRILKKKFVKFLLSPLLSWLRVRDFIGAYRPDVLIANSKTTQRRIAKYYRRESQVIYPPVSTQKRTINKLRKEYYIVLSRLAKQKGIELAIQACTKRNLPLLVIGTGSEENKLRSTAGETVVFLGKVPDSELPKLFSEAKALIYCSIEEDFGIVPVEAMSFGVPVIAYYSGGVMETVIDKKTGVFFRTYTVKALEEAMDSLESFKIRSSDCIKQAEKFSEEKFMKEMKKQITKYKKYANSHQN